MINNIKSGFSNVAHRPGWWWLVVAYWAVFIGTAYLWQYQRLQADAVEMATLRGRLVYSMVQITRAWNAGHGGLYAAITPDSPANPYLEHPDKFAETSKGKKLTLINPAYMTRQINTLLASQTDLKIHLTSLKPINPGNQPDEWEREALMSFEKGNKETVAFLQRDGETFFHYMAPLLVQKPCLQCHAKQGYQLGEVRGGLSVTQPASYITGIIESQRSSLLKVHLAAFLLLSSISVWSLWQNRRQLLSIEQERDQRKQTAEALADKVAELERTRDHLVQSEKHASLGRMVAGFSHEINTPIGIALSAISHNEETLKSLTAMMQQEEVREEDLLRHIDTLNQADKLAFANLRRAADLVRSFKRTSIDQASEAVRQFVLRELIDDVLVTLHNQFKRTQIAIAVDCAEGVSVRGVPGLLEQLLTNLLMNSLQHGFDNGQRTGHIQIAASFTLNAIHLRYTDDGGGMSPEVVAKAFEPFFTTARSSGGTGLGLYVCYNIVTEQLGGTINLTSTPGQGCCFDISIPQSDKNSVEG